MQEYSKRSYYALGPHTAARGLVFARSPLLGDRFARGAFVSQHGSWNRQPKSGYKLIFIPFDDRGLPVKGATPIDALAGFLSKDEDEDHGRHACRTDAGTGLLVRVREMGRSAAGERACP